MLVRIHGKNSIRPLFFSSIDLPCGRSFFLVYFMTVVARLAPGTYMFKTPVHSDARLHPSLFALIHRPSSTSVAKVLDRTRLPRIAGSFHMRSHSWLGSWKRPGSGAVPISTTPALAIVARDGHAHCLYKTRGATSQGAWTRSSIRLERPGGELGWGPGL